MLKLFLHPVTCWYYTEELSHLNTSQLKFDLLSIFHCLLFLFRSTTYSLLVSVSNKLGWSDQSNIFTFKTRDSGSDNLIWRNVSSWYNFSDYSSYNPGYFGKEFNFKFGMFFCHQSADQIQLNVFFRSPLWQRGPGEGACAGKNPASPDLLFPSGKSVRRLRSERLDMQ